MMQIFKRITRGILILLMAFVMLFEKAFFERILGDWIGFYEQFAPGSAEFIIGTGVLCVIMAVFNAAIGVSLYLAFKAFFNMDATKRQPNPWVVLLLVIVCTVVVPYANVSRGDTRLVFNLKMIFYCFGAAAVFAVYTFQYGVSKRPSPRWNSLAILMVASPWLFVGLNAWGLWPHVNVLAFFMALLRSLAIGIHEELPFRGILFRAFQGRSMVQYVLVSSIAFGLLHLYQDYRMVLPAAVMGCSFAMARVAGAPLGLLVACHALVDFKSALVSFQVLPQYPQYHLVAGVFFGVVLAIFVAFFIRRAD